MKVINQTIGEKIVQRNKLTAALLTVAMTGAASTAAIAAEPSPSLTGPQRLLFACSEQVLSIMAGMIDAKSCSALDGNYDLTVVAYEDQCQASVDDDFDLYGMRTDDTPNGTFIKTTSVSGDIDGIDVQNANNGTAGRVGTFAFSPGGEIMIHDAKFELKPGNNWEEYDEHVIKDYFAGNVFDGDDGVVDRGLEAITKKDPHSGKRLPRSKWREASEYREPDGQVGRHWVRKNQVIIEPFSYRCRMVIDDATVTDFGGGLESSGTLKVRYVGGR